MATAAAVKPKEDLASSPYYYLFEDADFKRWFQNVKRGSANTSHEWFRRFGRMHKRYGLLPADFIKMGKKKKAGAFLLDMVTDMEAEGKSGSYIANNVKPVKNWLAYHGIQINQKIKISNRNELTTVADERTPVQDELRKIMNAGTLRQKVGASLMAFSGLRPEVLGDFLGTDGLHVEDLPEMVVKGDGVVEFGRIPALVIVRRNLSKAGHQYFTFYPEEGCEYLKQSLELRIRKGEPITGKSPIMTQEWWETSIQRGHIRTPNLADSIRRPIRRAGFKWRPYVLRRYFDTRMMMAEMEGLIIRDFRVFWMGHKGDIEHTYTLNKQMPEDVIEKMREAYAKAAEKHLVTMTGGRGAVDSVRAQMNAQFLMVAGYAKEEIDAMPNLSKMTSEEMESLMQDKQRRKMGLNGNSQKVVQMDDIEQWISDGWEFVKDLPGGKAIIKLPN